MMTLSFTRSLLGPVVHFGYGQIVNLIGNHCSLFYNQNTKEKFDSDPEDCDQKDMYKLLVCFINLSIIEGVKKGESSIPLITVFPNLSLNKHIDIFFCYFCSEGKLPASGQRQWRKSVPVLLQRLPCYRDWSHQSWHSHVLRARSC